MSSRIWYRKSGVAFSQSYVTSTQISVTTNNKELQAHEDFLGFYNVPDIGADTIVSAIKDVLLKLQLS